MANPQSSSRRPKRMLKRAANLLTTTGNPVPAFEEAIMEHSEESSGASLSRHGLGASIRRKLQDAKDMPLVRSISLRSTPGSPGLPHRGARRHAKTFSVDTSTTRPNVVHTNSAPETINGSEREKIQPIKPLEDQIPPVSTQLPSRLKLTPKRSSMADVAVPELLQQGVPMLKVSAKRQKSFVFRIDPDQGQILWESKKSKIIPIENIKELRSASDARYYREQFQLAQEYEDRWLTIIYILDGSYKTLHLIASTKDVFQMWDITLRKLYTIRQELMSGLGNVEMRQAVWEKQYWKGADEGDQKLDFEEMERLCKRLNINSSTDTLLRLFKEADTQNRGYLDFTQFQHFVKMLKARPELDRLYKRLCVVHKSPFNFQVFEAFMRQSQKSSLSQPELERIFLKFASVPGCLSPVSALTSSTSLPPMTTPPSSAALSLPVVDSPLPLPEPTPQTPASAAATSPTATSAPTPTSTSTPAPPLPPSSASPSSLESHTLTLDGFTGFLLSSENSAFTDQQGKIWQDMSRPLSEYYISTSHNTYLVGHQLVGVSTIEGYIRALLHSCRSVELDIYDGDKEPVIFHGKTFTTKVSLRQVCQAIVKYAFVASPYPVIISAEIHCSLSQQDMIADIMTDVFGDILVRTRIDGQPKIELLPSPEALKGRILLKAKNLYVSTTESIRDKGVSVDTESSSTETSNSSASDTEMVQEMKDEWKKARSKESQVAKELKDEFKKARNSEAVKDIKGEFEKARQSVLGRVRGHKKTPSAVSQAIVGPPLAAAALKSTDDNDRPKVKMSLHIVALLVYTVGVKCRGINKKEQYAPEHVFSLSESTANKILKQGMQDLIKHNRTHVVRIYPKGLRMNSTNYEPHRYWSAGAQLVAINWQTFDIGYMINHAMFQRNGRSGFVLKPLALRSSDKELLCKRTKHILDIKVISAQQLPRLKDESGREIIGRSAIDPFVEVSIHVPDWTHSPFLPSASDKAAYTSPTAPTSSTTSGSSPSSAVNSTSARTVSYRTGVIKNNGFNPVWQEDLHLPFDCVGDMKDLVFVRFAVRHEGSDDDDPLAIYCTSLGSLQQGYRHLPLHDAQLSQYLFSTLFVHINIHDV